MPKDAIQEEIAAKFGKTPMYEKMRKNRKDGAIEKKRDEGLKRYRIKQKMQKSGLI